MIASKFHTTYNESYKRSKRNDFSNLYKSTNSSNIVTRNRSWSLKDVDTIVATMNMNNININNSNQNTYEYNEDKENKNIQRIPFSKSITRKKVYKKCRDLERSHSSRTYHSDSESEQL